MFLYVHINTSTGGDRDTHGLEMMSDHCVCVCVGSFPQVFVNEVNTHREQVLALEKAGSQLRFASLKQDVVLIKNLLLSVQARWDKLVQRSLDRGRHLDEARKRAKQVGDGGTLLKW